MSDYHSEVLGTLQDLKRYIDERTSAIDTRLDEQTHTVVDTARKMERLSTVHVDTALKTFRARCLQFTRGIE